jgi:hypothetical protein
MEAGRMIYLLLVPADSGIGNKDMSNCEQISRWSAWYFGSDIRSTHFYIGDHRVRERRCRLGSVRAELKRAVIVAVALIRFLSAIDLRTPRR